MKSLKMKRHILLGTIVDFDQCAPSADYVIYMSWCLDFGFSFVTCLEEQ